MQITAKIKNKSINYSPLLKPRVGTVVQFNGSFYSNVSGKNGSLSNPNDWIVIYNGSLLSKEAEKVAADISGTDPLFYIDLLSEGMPAFPTAISVYVDSLGNGEFLKLDPLIYEPSTRRVTGLNSPVDFPDQVIKVVWA